MQYTASTTPESYGQLLKRSTSTYFKAFPQVILLALIASSIAFMPRIISMITQTTPFAFSATFDPQKLWLILFNLIVLIFYTAILWRLQCRMAGNQDSLWNDFVTACKKLPRIIVASLIQTFCLVLVNLIAVVVLSYLLPKSHYLGLSLWTRTLITAMIVLQVLAALYVFFLFYFYLVLILTEGQGIFSSLQKSAVLVWKNFWRTLSFQLTPWLSYLLIIILIRSIFNIDLHIYFFADTHISTLSVCLHIILFALFIPWVAINMLVQLHDLELRKSII